ncbi:MAG: hypothetical protein J7L39_00280, partial [Candidatus Aenigmarchaeota archaeon]|nr:hypothetical protein [Candidatus Aenigmarchaeota archaeon]
LLKKRHFNPIFDIRFLKEDPYLIEEEPDIVVVGGVEIPSFLNYKGVTVLSTGKDNNKNIFWIIDLSTRETLKLEVE